MFRKRRVRRLEERLDAILGPTASFSGSLECDGSVRLEGLYRGGSITTLGHVIVTPTARVIADIQADTVSVAGAVEGTIRAHRVELLDGGRIWGEVHADLFLLDDGGRFDGRLFLRGIAQDVRPSEEAATSGKASAPPGEG
ncbi:MAG: bactofilin family protein [Anaerolineae bacterium]